MASVEAKGPMISKVTNVTEPVVEVATREVWHLCRENAGNAVDLSNRQQRKQMQNALWKTMERHEKRQTGKGSGGSGGGKGKGNNNAFGWSVQKQMFQKDSDKGGKKGKGKSKNKGKKGQHKGAGGWW